MDWRAWVIVLLTGSAGLPVYLLQRFDKRNSKQHASNMEVLQTIRDSVGEVRDDVRETRADLREVREDMVHHLEWHAEHPDK